tara:strand:- start:1298 stop:2224 length:927 start_codon:yes stop_codon:yes gene_type:complete
MDKEITQEGNPAIGMSSDSLESAEQPQGSSEDFFSALEHSVNSAIVDDVSEVTPTQSDPNIEANQTRETTVLSEPQSNTGDELTQMKKRYSDSSREAQRMKAQLDELKPFIPVLDAMKKDSGLVDHMRSYLKNGGDVPTNVKDELKLGEDFEFDVDDMVNDPKSDSAKVFHSMVNKVVNKKAGEILQQEEAKATETRQNIEYQNQAKQFMEERGMNQEEFLAFVDEAQGKIKGSLSLDDMYHLVNRDKVNKNVAANTKNDMMKQMKNVRNMPTSQAGVNNAGTSNKSAGDKMFEALLDFDSGVDNMFG